MVIVRFTSDMELLMATFMGSQNYDPYNLLSLGSSNLRYVEVQRIAVATCGGAQMLNDVLAWQALHFHFFTLPFGNKEILCGGANLAGFKSMMEAMHKLI